MTNLVTGVSSRLKIGQICRVYGRGGASEPSVVDYRVLTAGRHGVPADPQKGMFFYREVSEPGQAFRRLPAFVFHSNPLTTESSTNPWSDVVDADAGYALFHGDNKSADLKADESRGNGRIIAVQEFYDNPQLRKYAPPILLFRQCEVNGRRKGHREFSGYGIPTALRRITQRDPERGGFFSNYAIDITLFSLDREENALDWAWIDARRDGTMRADDILGFAPYAWRQWVKEGAAIIENCRRGVYRSNLVSIQEQRTTGRDLELLEKVRQHYGDKHHVFEGFASLVASKVLGQGFRRGWVTRRSADGGYDFVGRMEFGDRFGTLSRVPLVVLGQAKCHTIKSVLGGHDIARLVARLQRGWLGVFVTTGSYSQAAQKELLTDKYPVVLINGKRLTKSVADILISEHIDVENLLAREDAWYQDHFRSVAAEKIINEVF